MSNEPDFTSKRTKRWEGWEGVMTFIDTVRETKKDDAGESIPSHVHDRILVAASEGILETRAELFNAPGPYAFLRDSKQLIKFEKDNPKLSAMMRQLGFSNGQTERKMVMESMTESIANEAPVRDVYKLGAMLKGAIYVNGGDNRIFKITNDDITECVNGVDGVICIEDNLEPWPELTPENLEYIAIIRKQLSGAGMRYTPDTPLGRHLTPLWDDQEMTPEQTQQLFFSRFMFLWVANEYDLWPITLHIGEQNSGKSTPFEMITWLLFGPEACASALPAAKKDLIASLTNNPLVVYDNIDGAGLDEKSKAEFMDTFCHVATGAVEELRELYKNNILLKYKLRNHMFLTSRTVPFTRSDTMRRVLKFSIRKPAPSEVRPKNSLKRELLAERDHIMLEILVRLQNIVIDHTKCGAKEYQPDSQMLEYETYTLRCAEAEGFLPEMRGVWQAYRRTYEADISQSNPMVHLLRYWLGKPKHENIGRTVSPAVLWQDLSAICEQIGEPMTYSSSSKFGANLKMNITPLRTLGIKEVGNSSHSKYKFEPEPQVMIDCESLLKEVIHASLHRSIGNSLSRMDRNTTKIREDKARPMPLDDDIDDISDTPSSPRPSSAPRPPTRPLVFNYEEEAA